MSKPLSIGLTGGIGSGKSTVADFFRLLGVPVYTSDKEAKALMQCDPHVRKCLIEAFGNAIYDSSGKLNREALAKIIFNSTEALDQVNAIVHPQVRLHYQQWMASQCDVPYVIQESAILFDTGLYRNFDKIITVTADKEIRISRVLNRDLCSRDSVLKRMNKQMSELEKIDKADFVIYNNTELLIPQIIQIHEQLLML